MFKRILMIVLDSVGAGDAPDAKKYNDYGSNTLLHVYQKEKPNVRTMISMGLLNILGLDDKDISVKGAYGKAIEKSAGKDTTTGHWEMMGLEIEHPFPTFPNGFPDHIIEKFNKITGTKCIGNCVASGTEIINMLGDEHLRTGYPIVYTSADSVFQIACHEEIYPIDKIYKICEETRKILTGEYAVGRVIARPFIGNNGNYKRTQNRKDFSLNPIGDTVLNLLHNNGIHTHGIGKIEDIFNKSGLTSSDHAHGNTECINSIYKALNDINKGLIFANLVDFDMIYGHRRDTKGYANALEEFDVALKNFTNIVNDDDLILMTADHGCDPTYKGTDHTREMVPIIAWNKKMDKPINIGIRYSFADIAATIAENFGFTENFNAHSFLNDIR